ncbi:MAG: hypothetical protein IPN01_21850 [Deltaproteobacteria bacterium]|nr:hypothetical protein [Deltaproteobacteria bacterium]
MRRSILLCCSLLIACNPDPDDKLNDSIDTQPVEVNQDEDGDGVEFEEDCDDLNAEVFPGAPELCDGLDNDCDGSVDDEPSDAPAWHADADGDGYGDPNSAVVACEAPAGLIADNSDCDDATTTVNPAAAEVCDGLDNNCDGLADGEDAADAATWHNDDDGDGYGDLATAQRACEAPEGTIADATDCDDDDDDVNPGATERCATAEDDDCDGQVNEDDAPDATVWYGDADLDGFGDAAVTTLACAQPSGAVSDATDCDDRDFGVNPDAEEVCDGLDNNCDGSTDGVDASDIKIWYTDADTDGFGDPASIQRACDAPKGAVADSTDCDDGDDDVNPDAAELCDGLDNNCDGSTDGADATDTEIWYTDADKDGFGDATSIQRACDAPTGTVADDDDCDDGDDEINPDADELCDGQDNDCDGSVDDGASGLGSDCAALSCLDVLASGETASGIYTIDPDDDGDTSNAVEAYCDLTSDGGGWTLVSWTGDSTKTPLGTPYPGLAVCSTLDCQRGSAASESVLEALIQVSTSIGVGHSLAAMASYDLLGDYDYAVSYDYLSLAGFTLSAGDTLTTCTPFATGSADVLAGPTDADGATVYLAQGFFYASGHGSYSESSSYIWLVSAPSSYCNGSGSAPGSWLGNWSASEHEYGPYERSTTGARSVWVR